MLDDIREMTLTPAEASAWLRHVVSEEMSRVRESRSIVFANGGADTCADWAMATAWRMLAQRSVNAELADEDIEDLKQQGRSAAEIDQLDITLDMLGQDMRSEARIRRLGRAFGDLTGVKEQIPAAMLLQLRKIFIEGRAAAWEQMPPDQGMSVASELAAELAAQMTKQERDVFRGVSQSCDNIMSTAPVEQPENGRTISETVQDLGSAQEAANEVFPMARSPAHPFAPLHYTQGAQNRSSIPRLRA